MGKVTSLFLMIFAVGSVQAESYLETDRYTKVELTSTEQQRDPLNVVVQVKFPVSVVTTKDAMEYLLDESGYALVDPKLWPEEVEIMMGNTLAAVHRDLVDTPMPITDVLSVLAGTPFRMVRDPLRRKITFKLLEKYKGLIDG